MGRPKLTLAEYQERIDKRWPGKFSISSYLGAHSLTSARCHACQTEFVRAADDLLKRGQCPSCDSYTESRKAEAMRRAEEVAGPNKVLEPERRVNGDREAFRYRFSCPKHGPWAVNKLGSEARCPRCHRSLPPTHPDRMPLAARGRPAVVYLIQVRDCVGIWTKVGIAADMKAREGFYKRDGIRVIRHIRCFHTTRYNAAVIEMRIKQWARKNLGRRVKPRKSWSGWSESFVDGPGLLPGIFDKFVLDRTREL